MTVNNGTLEVLNVLALATGVAYAVLAAFRNRLCWIAGAVSSVCAAVLSGANKLPMQAALQLFYVGMSVYGWWSWSRSRNDGELEVGVWPLRRHLVAGLALAAISLVSARWLPTNVAAWPLLEAAGGRAFVLFTSHRALAEGAAWMRDRVSAGLAFPVLIQGDAPREQLLRQFRELGNAVLLGTGSFWEGVDVKGQALSLVVIDKLPFASPDDPVLAARLEAIRRHGGKPFSEYQLPQAVLALKQGVGRLIRDRADAGVVMMCDPRLMTRTYGRVFVESLPPMPATIEVREAIALLERVTSRA